MKGYVKGGLWGLVCGGVGLSVASLSHEQPPFATGPEVPQMAAPELANADDSVALPETLSRDTDSTPDFGAAGGLSVETAGAEAAPVLPTETAQVPSVGAVEDPEPQTPPAQTLPLVSEDIADANKNAALFSSTQDDVPGVEAPAIIVAEEPENDAVDDAVVTMPAPPPTPEVAEVAREEMQTAEIAIEVSEPAPAAQEPPVLADIDARVTDENAEAVTTLPAVTADEPEITPTPPAPDTPVQSAEEETTQVDEPLIADVDNSVGDDTQAAIATPTDVTDAAPDPAPAAEQDTSSDQGVTVAQALPQVTSAVRVNRPGAAPEVPQPAAPAQEEEAALPDDAPALLRYAAPYENQAGLPEIAVVLIDTDQGTAEVADLSSLGFVPTIAVNALADGAADKAAAYRAAGFEVAMQADLPSGAQPVDVEVAFEAAFQMVPETGILFSLGTGAIENRAITTQVMQILAESGRGFVTVQRGLSDATRVAVQAGVPVTTIQREIDGANEDGRAMARALDQAAFRARQTGDVVVLGRLTAATVAALQDWATDLDQSSLSIAPVSAILLGQGE